MASPARHAVLSRHTQNQQIYVLLVCACGRWLIMSLFDCCGPVYIGLIGETVGYACLRANPAYHVVLAGLHIHASLDITACNVNAGAIVWFTVPLFFNVRHLHAYAFWPSYACIDVILSRWALGCHSLGRRLVHTCWYRWWVGFFGSGPGIPYHLDGFVPIQ